MRRRAGSVHRWAGLEPGGPSRKHLVPPGRRGRPRYAESPCRRRGRARYAESPCRRRGRPRLAGERRAVPWERQAPAWQERRALLPRSGLRRCAGVQRLGPPGSSPAPAVARGVDVASRRAPVALRGAAVRREFVGGRVGHRRRLARTRAIRARQVRAPRETKPLARRRAAFVRSSGFSRSRTHVATRAASDRLKAVRRARDVSLTRLGRSRCTTATVRSTRPDLISRVRAGPGPFESAGNTCPPAGRFPRFGGPP